MVVHSPAKRSLNSLSSSSRIGPCLVTIGRLVELVDDSGKGIDSDDNLDVVAGSDSIGGIGGADVDLVVAGDTSVDVDSSS